MNIPKTPIPYCYDEASKQAHSRAIRKVYRAAAKLLPEFVVKTHFNPGGIAVWGETTAKLFVQDKPVAEAYDTYMGMLVRQWDGRNSGHNHYVDTLEQFIELVRVLASKPFVRF